MMAGPSGGETQKDPSGFTTDTLHALMSARFEHIDRVLGEMDRRYEQRFVAQEQAVGLALTRVDKEFHEHLQQVREETHASLDAADKAIQKSERATELRFESVNEFRSQLSDQARLFMPRAEAEQRTLQNTHRIDDLERRHGVDVAQINSRLDLAAGRGAGVEKGWGYLVAAAGLVATIVAIIYALGK